MIEESATVIKVEGSSLTLKAEPSSACGHCSAQSACGQGLLSKYFNQNPGQITIPNRLDNGESLPLVTGDKVVIGIEESSVLGGAFYAYLLPLVFVVVFAGLAQVLGIESELQQILIVLAGLFLGLSSVRYLLNDQRQYLKDILPVLLRKDDQGGNRIHVFQEDK